MCNWLYGNNKVWLVVDEFKKSLADFEVCAVLMYIEKAKKIEINTENYRFNNDFWSCIYRFFNVFETLHYKNNVKNTEQVIWK